MDFITEIINYINNKYDLSKDFLTIIFPNQRAALELRKKIKETQKNIWLPQILSIQEAMSMWSGMHLVENIDVTFELIKILNNHKYSSDSDVFGLASQLTKDFDEIDQYKVNAKKLFAHLHDAKKIEQWNKTDEPNEKSIEERYIEFFASLYKYYLDIRDTLEKDESGYYGMITRKLSEMDETELIKAVGNNNIIFAGFNAMTATEEDIIVKLVRNKKAEILWDLDAYYFEDEQQEAGFFAREFFKKHKDIECIPSIIKNRFNDANNKKNINIIGVSGSTIQTNALIHKLTQKNDDNKPKDDNNTLKEVIVLSDESLLIPVLNSIPNSYDDIIVTMGYPYSKTILHQFIMQLFVFQKYINEKDEKIYFWALKKILETELSKIIFTRQELSVIEKLLNDSIYYLESNNLEKYFNNRLLQFVEKLKIKWTPENCIDSIKTILQFIDGSLTEQLNGFNFIKKQIAVAERILNKINRLSEKYKSIINIEDIQMLYSQSANEMSINLKKNIDPQSSKSEEKTRELQIMGLLETRNLDFDIIHILSVNEGILPQSKSANTLIPYDIRFNYNLPIYQNKQAVYAYHFYRLLQNAKTINIYHNTLAGSTGESEPSRFIRQILHEMPKKSDKKHVEIIDTIYKNPDINVSDAPTFEITKNDIIIDKIKERFYGDKKDGTKKGLSPTSISTYLKCPMNFYLEYIEGVKEDVHEELVQSNEIGSIIHSFLELLYNEFGDKQFNLRDFEDVVKNKSKEIYQKALIVNKFPNGLPNTGFNYLSTVMIKELIENFIKYEKNFLKDKDLKIVALEKQLYQEFQVGDCKINLTGYADRIDKVIENRNETIRIIDYKTGSVNDDDVKISDKKNSLSELPEKSLQLLTYKYLYRKMNNGVNSFKVNKIEPAIYGLLRMNNVYFPLVNNNTTTFKCNEENDDAKFIENCDGLFQQLIEEILNIDIKFTQTSKTENCKYCGFKDICKRYPKGY